MKCLVCSSTAAHGSNYCAHHSPGNGKPRPGVSNAFRTIRGSSLNQSVRSGISFGRKPPPADTAATSKELAKKIAKYIAAKRAMDAKSIDAKQPNKTKGTLGLIVTPKGKSRTLAEAALSKQASLAKKNSLDSKISATKKRKFAKKFIASKKGKQLQESIEVYIDSTTTKQRRTTKGSAT